MSSSCSTCGGWGLYGGELSGRYAGPWKWCSCPAGVERKRREPGAVDEGNEARSKLLKRFGPKPLGKIIDLAADAYHGEF